MWSADISPRAHSALSDSFFERNKHVGHLAVFGNCHARASALWSEHVPFRSRCREGVSSGDSLYDKLKFVVLSLHMPLRATIEAKRKGPEE